MNVATAWRMAEGKSHNAIVVGILSVGTKRWGWSRSRIECEAESVSFCIMHHFGLDVGEVAFGYLAHWGDGENALTELLECGERIRGAAHQVIAWIDEQYAEVVLVDGLGTLILQAETELVPA